MSWSQRSVSIFKVTTSPMINRLKLNHLPDTKISVTNVFNINLNAYIPAFSKPNELVPPTRLGFQFDRRTTLCILAGLVYNKRVLIAGKHGTGKSTHIEQVCNRLNWGCIRINMDNYLTKSQLIGKESLIFQHRCSVVKFKYGLLPWALRRPIVLILDDYDVCTPEVKSIFNKLLGENGEINIPENGRVIKPNASFRILATSTTLFGSQISNFRENSAHLDKWNMVINAPKLSFNQELKLVNQITGKATRENISEKIVKLARMLRRLQDKGKLSLPFSVRSLLSWAELTIILNSIGEAFKYAYLNKCKKSDRLLIYEKYTEVFGSTCSIRCG
ncbi:Cobalamin biosynthesis protein CobS [Candidatus Hodgkinia cicadicola]|uniref:Cobalamin biosynthesis protein CobS n=1 Tax=Candidatus Hodgkinia cicadicola TaxID=573658 RepID=A0ABX4MET9_9HYPH|nr:Cobalamin biosynthesis protein CobS [Candidatus Hodgkinia cicadicola]